MTQHPRRVGLLGSLALSAGLFAQAQQPTPPPAPAPVLTSQTAAERQEFLKITTAPLATGAEMQKFLRHPKSHHVGPHARFPFLHHGR